MTVAVTDTVVAALGLVIPCLKVVDWAVVCPVAVWPVPARTVTRYPLMPGEPLRVQGTMPSAFRW